MTIRKNIRPVAEIAEIGADYDARGYPLLALWFACFLQAYEATHPEAAQ